MLEQEETDKDFHKDIAEHEAILREKNELDQIEMEHKAKKDRTKDPWNDGELPVPCSEDSDGELHSHA